MNYENNIGKRVSKGSITRKETNNKPFKSGLVINTVKGVITHPTLDIPAYTFDEDDSYVECRRCIVFMTPEEFNVLNNNEKWDAIWKKKMGIVMWYCSHCGNEQGKEFPKTSFISEICCSECYNTLTRRTNGGQNMPCNYIFKS